MFAQYVGMQEQGAEQARFGKSGVGCLKRRESSFLRPGDDYATNGTVIKRCNRKMLWFGATEGPTSGALAPPGSAIRLCNLIVIPAL